MSLLKKTTVAILGTAVVLTASAGAFADGKKRGDRDGRGSMQMFERVDTNDDDQLDFAEFAAPMNERFDAIDADEDGIITEAEIQTAREEREERRAKRIAGRFDSDDNGEITKAEIEERQKEMFARLDADEDGFISVEEAKKMKRGGKRSGKRGGDRT